MTENKGNPIEISGPSELGSFLSNELGLVSTKWKPENVNSLLAPYVKQLSAPESSLPIVEFHIPDARDAGNLWLNCPWDHLLNQLGCIVGMICAAGGSTAFLTLLKAWVEERKGRKIVIKKNGTRLELHGGVSKAKLKEVIELFESSLRDFKILKP